jgi:hypothetical protein
LYLPSSPEYIALDNIDCVAVSVNGLYDVKSEMWKSEGIGLDQTAFIDPKMEAVDPS